MANLETKRLRMVSWNQELVLAAMYDRAKLGRILNVKVPDEFPNEPVRELVLPLKLNELRQDSTIGQWSGMIIHVLDAIIIGSMGFKQPPDETGTLELGYDIIPKYQGNGYATEMAKALVDWAFDQPGVDRVIAECLSTNIPSIRVLEKIGMKQLEPFEGMLNWEITKQ